MPPRFSSSVDHLGKRDGDLFEMLIQCPRVKHRNLSFYEAAQAIWLQMFLAFHREDCRTSGLEGI